MNEDTTLVVGEPPGPFFEALGRLVYEFSHLDGVLGALLSVQVRLDNTYVTGLLTSGETTDWLRSKCLTIMTATEAYSPFTAAEREELRTHLALIKGLLAKRNRFVHSQWYFMPKFDEMHGFMDRRSGDVHEFGTSVAEIAQVATDTQRVREAIHSIIDRLEHPQAKSEQPGE